MKKITFILFFIFLFRQIGYTQIDSSGIERITKVNNNYFSFVTVNDKLYAINDSGRLVIWDLNKFDTIHFNYNNEKFRYISITKDRNNQVFIGTTNGSVYKLDTENLSLKLYIKDKYPIFSICFSSDDKMFLIVPYVVYNPSSKKYWNKFKHEKNGTTTRKKVFGLFWKKTNKYFNMPDYVFTDSHNKIWMINSFGEFGGSIQIFDMKRQKEFNKKLMSLDMGLLFPKSVFEDTVGNIYLTSGLQHFGSSGEIYKIDRKLNVTKIYDGRNYNDTIQWKIKKDELAGKYEGVFVGPGAYNKNDNSIYFASNKGFYKAKHSKQGNLETPELLINPKLQWQSEPMAIGVAMTVKRLEFTIDNRLLFLTTKDGFGIYDGNYIKFLK